MTRRRKQSSPNRLQRKQGIWVFTTGEPMATDETAQVLRKVRAQRDWQNAGKGHRK